MSFQMKKIGPSSAQKKRKGGKSRGHKKQNPIDDYDVESCFFGVIDKINDYKQVSVMDMRNNKIVHCTLRGMTARFLNKGSIVVFSYTRGDTSGEVLATHSTDHLQSLCDHFKINFEKASKSAGISTSINRNCSDELPDIMIASNTDDSSVLDSSNKKSNNSYDDLYANISDDDDYKVEVKQVIDEIDEDENIVKSSSSEEDELGNRYKPFKFGKSLNKHVVVVEPIVELPVQQPKKDKKNKQVKFEGNDILTTEVIPLVTVTKERPPLKKILSDEEIGEFNFDDI
jgi:hypothetical protein